REILERIYRTAAVLMARSASAPKLTATGDLRPGWRTHVHGRDRRPCRRCGEQIATIALGRPPYTRPGYFCPRCQPSPSSITTPKKGTWPANVSRPEPDPLWRRSRK